MKEFIATTKDELKRLDVFLMNRYIKVSRKIIKKTVDDGNIRVNNKRVTAHYKIKNKDVVTINSKIFQENISEQKEGIEIVSTNLNLEILYEDENIIAVNKPVGFNSQPASKKDTSSILNGLYYIFEKRNLDNKIRLLHRLDKDTSGVLVASKNIEAHYFYSSQFENREIKKIYLAVCHGNFEEYLSEAQEEFVTLRSYLARVDSNKFKNVDQEKGKLAVTSFYFESHFDKFGKNKFSVVKAIPKTGRTHQIRVHLSSLGFPILGDKIYGGQKYKRLMLHSFSLILNQYKEKRKLKIVAQIPKEFS